MKGSLVLRAPFRVIRSVSWEATHFGVVDVEVRDVPEDSFFPARISVRLLERQGKPSVYFDADAYTFDGRYLRFRINTATDRWVFEALH